VKLNQEMLDLRWRILDSMRQQGFVIHAGQLTAPDPVDKERLRSLHATSVKHRVEQAREGLFRHEDRLLGYIANGSEVLPERICPRLIEVEADSEEELLFRYARLHWSIPVSAGYGRRVRFLVVDDANGKLMGLFGLCDPVYGLAPRDRWVGWNKEEKRERLRNVMDAFVLGAVPPYSSLLCGKLVALMVTTDEVRDAVLRKYGGRRAQMSGKVQDGRLVLATTTSALGRSSIYNRLRVEGDPAYISVGFTLGSGEFHFSNGVYHDLKQFAIEHCDATAKDQRWGVGFRNRRELIRKALPKLGLSPNMIYHGVQREIFVIPLAKNSREFLNSQAESPEWFDRTVRKVFAGFRERWLIPRAARDESYRAFDRESYRIWRKP
jgi:hypothetical protein